MRPMRPTRKRRARGEAGSAYIMVLLVLVVLTIMGLKFATLITIRRPSGLAAAFATEIPKKKMRMKTYLRM